MDHPGDIGETLAWTRGQRLFGPLCGGMAEELRHRLALDSGRSPDLVIKVGIKPKASHISTVSHLCSHVIQLGMADLRSDRPPLPCRSTVFRSGPCHQGRNQAEGFAYQHCITFVFTRDTARDGRSPIRPAAFTLP